MKTKAKTIEDCATLFEIEVPRETIATAFEEVYGEITRVASIPGFRTGHAPKELVRKHYTKNAREEVLKRLIPMAISRALEEHKVSPIGLPEISEVSFDEEKMLSFKARVDTRPKFKLKEYKSLKLERKKAVVSDEDVGKAIENLRELSAKYVPVETRPVAMGDYCIGDLDCSVDGKPIHKKRENIWIYVDSQALVPELSEKMVGMNAGEEKTLDVKMPDKYPDKTAAGKTASYRVKVHQIKTRELPVLDDEFAKTLSRPNLEELKAEVRRELEARANSLGQIELENKLLNTLMDSNVFPVPSRLAARQLDYMVEDAKARLIEKGFKKEELDKKDKDFRDKFKEDAVRRVRLLFILDEIASEEGIEALDEDLQKAYQAIAAQAQKSANEVKAHYEKEDLVGNIKDKIREEKTIEFLLKSAQVSEV